MHPPVPNSELPSSKQPIARVVMLGASNLRLGLPIAVQHSIAALSGPLAFYVAHGFGRSYGKWSSIPTRALPGITECQLWDDLERDATCQPSLPTFAMLTDVGNDLLYGASAERLIGWLEVCIDRLRAHNAQISIAELPIASILGTNRLRYKIFRTIFFPPSELTLNDACARANDTNNRLQQVAKAHGYRTIAMPESWYGIDPIHIRRRFRQVAWRSIVEACTDSSSSNTARGLSLKNRISIELAKPYECRFLGRHRTNAQPYSTLSDGSTIGFY